MKAAERQRLKHDKYADTVVSALQWAKKHQSKVIAVAASVMLLAGVIVWVIHSRIQAREEAQAQYADCLAKAERAMEMKDPERTEAIKEAVASLDGLVNSYPESEVAPLALLDAAELMSESGQPAKAVAYYERLLGMAGASEGTDLLARRGMAESYEQTGEMEKALAQYKALAEALALQDKAQGENYVSQDSVEADWDIGRCCEALKDPQSAKSYYEKARDSGGDSKWADLARFRLESIERGPTTPVSAAPATTVSAPAATASAPATARAIPAATAPAAAATSPNVAAPK